MHGGFHGKTLGALSVTGRAQYRDPFGPPLPMVDFVPFGDPAALRAVLTAQSVVLLEPVQAEGVSVARLSVTCGRSGGRAPRPAPR